MTHTQRWLWAAIPVVCTLTCWGQALKVPPVPEGVTGFRAEFLKEISGEEAKFISLAEAIPAEKYTWRPGPDVRSVSEVLLHVSGANFTFPKIWGTKPPEGFSAVGYDKSTTDKTQILDALHKSFAHLRDATAKLTDADGEKPVKLFGDNTYRGVTYFILKHQAEHLGQMIVYARMTGVVPSWTQEQQKKPVAVPAPAPAPAPKSGK